jgi:hypothetical protein
MTFEQVETQLMQLEARSGGLMHLDTAGYTLEGRPLYIAKLGTGAQRMWLQGRIHGNEPLGNDVCLAIIKSLLSNNRALLDKMTFWIIPMYNPDGAAHFWRGNANGVDLNRNWYRGNATSYSEPESKAFYAAWKAFKPHYAIDLHHQGTYLIADTNIMTTFSIGIPVASWRLDPWVWDTNREMAVTGFDSLQKVGYVHPSRYPDIDIPTSVVGSMMLDNPGPDGSQTGWVTAAMFFENRGGIGNRSRGYIVQQMLVSTGAIIASIYADTLKGVDPSRWDEIPFRLQDNLGADDKWPNE